MEVGNDLLGVRKLLLVKLEVVDALGPSRVDVHSADWNPVSVTNSITLFVCLDEVEYLLAMDQVFVDPDHVRMGPLSVRRSLIIGFKEC